MVNGTGSSSTVTGNDCVANYPNTVTGYSTDLQAWIVRVSEIGGLLPSAAQLTKLDTYISDLVADGLWSRMKTQYFPLWGNSTNLRVNVVDPSTYERTIHLDGSNNALVYDSDDGYRSDGSSFINDQFKTDELFWN